MLGSSLTVRLATKRMNARIGREGLVPSLLVFGFLPSSPITNKPLPSQRKEMTAIDFERTAMRTIVAKIGIEQTLRSELSPSTYF